MHCRVGRPLTNAHVRLKCRAHIRNHYTFWLTYPVGGSQPKFRGFLVSCLVVACSILQVFAVFLVFSCVVAVDLAVFVAVAVTISVSIAVGIDVVVVSDVGITVAVRATSVRGRWGMHCQSNIDRRHR